MDVFKNIDLTSLLNDGEVFEINPEDYKTEVDSYEYLGDVDDEVARVCLDDDDDEIDYELTQTPFEKLEKTMEDVTSDGKVKKKILRKGTGPTPPEDASVTIHYASYLEYNDEPTDCAFLKKPYSFRLGKTGIVGMTVAILSMQVNEKSLFLIDSDYAFGRMGHPPRIPPNSRFLFQIELLKFLDNASAVTFDSLSAKEKVQFDNVIPTAKAFMENAKEAFKHNVKLAIKNYNKAKSVLEECQLKNIEEQKEQQKLLLHVLTNLAVCYTKANLPKKACCSCNEIYFLTKNTSSKITSKVYFHNGRALFMLGEYDKAYTYLKKAKELEPSNVDISNEISAVLKKKAEDEEKEIEFAKLSLQTITAPREDKNAADFRKQLRIMCNNLKTVSKIDQFKLPSELSEIEIQIAKEEAAKCNFKFHQRDYNDDKNYSYFITKY